MVKEGIKIVELSISLIAGDYIVDNLGKIEEVGYIDYAREMVVALSMECESVTDDISLRQANIISFDSIASGCYEKVVR